MSLKHVVIPDNVERIDCYAFHNCTSLTSISIPHNIKCISETAFTKSGLDGAAFLCHTASIMNWGFVNHGNTDNDMSAVQELRPGCLLLQVSQTERTDTFLVYEKPTPGEDGTESNQTSSCIGVIERHCCDIEKPYYIAWRYRGQVTAMPQYIVQQFETNAHAAHFAFFGNDRQTAEFDAERQEAKNGT